jgi:hypothetical protein
MLVIYRYRFSYINKEGDMIPVWREAVELGEVD